MEIDIKIDEFVKELKEILSPVAMQPFYDDAANIMENAIATQFERNGAYFDTPWEPLKASTIRDRAKHGYNGTNILRRLGSAGLLGSISVYSENRFIIMQVGKTYGKYHQKGTRKFPARPFLPETLEALPESVVRELGSAWARFAKNFFS